MFEKGSFFSAVKSIKSIWTHENSVKLYSVNAALRVGSRDTKLSTILSWLSWQSSYLGLTIIDLAVIVQNFACIL